MKNKGISIAAILIICVFVVTIAALGLSIYSAYKVGSENAADRFEKLSSRTMELSGIYPCGSKEFLTAFNDSVNAPNFYENLRLEIDGIEVYIYPSFPMSTPSTFAKTFSTRIMGGDGARIELSANIYALSPATIFNRAKIAFIVILGGTLIAGILLVFTYLSEAEEGEKIAESKIDEPVFSDDEATEDDLNLTEEYLDEENLDDSGDEKNSEQKSENENSSPQRSAEQNVPAEENRSEQKSEEQVAKTDPEENKVQSPAEPSDLADEIPQEKNPVSTEAPSSSEEGNCDDQKNEQGLFSPTSGFGWESYLDTRLGSELIRAASSEQELSLLVIKIPGMTVQSDYYAKVCKTLLDFFQFKDFVFEYKEDGFAAIIQGKGIDEAMESAESLYANLKSTLHKERANTQPLIGISSRSLRLISAERLKTEAEQAAEHASTDNESPIVAFRVNPEKYRKFITEQKEE